MSSANASEAEEILHLLFTEDNIQDTGQAPQTGRESQDVAFRLSYRYLYMRLKVTKTHFMGQLSRQVTEWKTNCLQGQQAAFMELSHHLKVTEQPLNQQVWLNVLPSLSPYKNTLKRSIDILTYTQTRKESFYQDLISGIFHIFAKAVAQVSQQLIG